MAVDLTQGAITRMCSRDNLCCDEKELKPVLQVIKVEEVPPGPNDDCGERRSCLSLSDGSHWYHGFLADEVEGMIRSGRLQKGSAVQLTRFVAEPFYGRKVLAIFDLDVLVEKCEVIGEPVPLPKKCNCTTFCGWAFCGSNKLLYPPADSGLDFLRISD